MSGTTPAVAMRVLPEPYVICQLERNQLIDLPRNAGSLYALTRTSDEVSLVCAEADMPTNTTKQEPGWSALMVEGPMDFALTGVLAAIAAPLAEARIPIFAISTYDTDYVLVRQAVLASAITVLEMHHHTIRR
jgi:hypothetical protein